MTKASLKDNQGVAIIITLTVIVLLITAALEINRKAVSAMEYSGVTRDRITLSHMASSGIHGAMAILIKDKKAQGNNNNVDSVQDDWADPEVVAEVITDIPFDDGTLMVTISDELGRIQVNSLVNYPVGHGMNNIQYEMWERFLGYISPAESEDDDTAPRSIISSIIDWIDFGDDDLITGVNGAESDYYKDLDTPYACTNSPMAHVKELLLVKGVPELVDSIGGFDAISGYLTVHGMVEDSTKKKYTFPGKININTADLAVIAAILKEDSMHLAENVMAHREEVKDDGTYLYNLSKLDWYKDVEGIEPDDIKKELITTHSDFFRIEAVAEINKVKLTTTAVVFREKIKSGKYRCRVLSWETE
ncbi:MAG: general secretion pathway protein GspK [Desulfobacula sp.]|nr:general secretion pathway protein GspK [Desulfobacula sp.]